MRQYHIWAWLCVSLLAGCAPEPPPPLPSAPTASETLRADEQAIAGRFAEQERDREEQEKRDRAEAERRKQFETAKELSKRWSEARKEAGNAVRDNLTGPMAKLEAVKREAETLDVNDCTAKARTVLVESTTAMLDAMTTFRQQTGDPDPALKEKISLADKRFFESEALLAPCKATP